MADRDIVNPGNSSYSLPTPGHVSVGNVPSMSMERTLPRQLSTGSTRGTQTVGYGLTKIDGSNNTIRVGDSIFLDGNNGILTVGTSKTGQQGLGDIPNTVNQSGFFQTDITGVVVYKLINGTTYVYNAQDNYVNTILIGFAPNDGRPGIWVAKPTFSAEELLA